MYVCVCVCVFVRVYVCARECVQMIYLNVFHGLSIIWSGGGWGK